MVEIIRLQISYQVFKPFAKVSHCYVTFWDERTVKKINVSFKARAVGNMIEREISSLSLFVADTRLTFNYRKRKTQESHICLFHLLN